MRRIQQFNDALLTCDRVINRFEAKKKRITARLREEATLIKLKDEFGEPDAEWVNQRRVRIGFSTALVFVCIDRTSKFGRSKTARLWIIQIRK